MKLLYLGLPLGALMLHREGHALVGACISRTSLPGMRRLRRVMASRGAPLLGRPDLAHPSVWELLASTEPDLVVSWFWTRRIPRAVAQLAPNLGINVHPSLLPRHRGADPYFWTLANRDKETGVTVHRLSERYDEGAILAQRRVPVPPDINAWQLARLLDRPSLELLRDVVRSIERGALGAAVEQDSSLATEAPAPTDEDCELVWDWPVDKVVARVRAAAPSPGAFTGYGDETIVVLRAWRAVRPPKALSPGDVVATSEGVVVCAADGAVVLAEARREGDERVHRGRAVIDLFPGIGVVER